MTRSEALAVMADYWDMNPDAPTGYPDESDLVDLAASVVKHTPVGDTSDVAEAARVLAG